MPSPSEADEPTPRPPLLLRLALHAYPAADRRGYGDELLEAALELAGDGGTELREAGGLVQGGFEARLARVRYGLSAVDLAGALRLLTLPLAALATMIWAAAAGARMTGATIGWADQGATVGSVALLSILALLVLGVARAQRGIATFAATALFLQVLASALWHTARGGVVTASPALHLNIGWWWFGPNITWSLLPLLLLLIPACWFMRPAAPRIPGVPRPLTELGALRLAVLVLPAVLFGALLHVAPQYLIAPGSGDTTQLPGLLVLMLVVAALWVARVVPGGRERAATASALVAMGASPSIAYGASRLVLSPLGQHVENRDLYVALGLVIAVVLVLLAAAMFAVVLANVGLRAIDRRGGSPLAVGHAIALGPDGQPQAE
jgi:hypothetical protein